MAHLSAPHSVAGFVSDRDAAPRDGQAMIWTGVQGFLSRIMALRIVSSFLATAINALSLAFPLAIA
jgi:hypothetical protein